MRGAAEQPAYEATDASDEFHVSFSFFPKPGVPIVALSGRNFDWAFNPDGTKDGHYPTGNKNPSVSALAWNESGLATFAALIVNRTTGSSFSSDVRQYLTGTNAATATLSVVTVSGTDVTVGGWGISGDNVTNTGSVQSSGFLKIGANDGTGTVYTVLQLPWSWVSGATDTLAPCIPTGGQVVEAAGSVTFSCDIPGDAHDGTQAGAMSKVQLRIAGSTVEEKTVGAGLSPTWTLLNFGSSLPAPSFSQSGNIWTLIGGGAGFDSTTESFPFSYTTISGDFILTCKVTDFSSSVHQFSKCGLMIRENITGLDRFFAVYIQESDGSIQTKQRSTQGGVAGNQFTGTAGIALPLWFQVERAGAAFQTRYSTNGITWLDITAPTLGMSGSVYVGFFVTSKVSGSAVTATMEQIWLSVQGRVTFTPISTVVAKIARFRAKDAANNLSAESASITGTPVAGAAYKKWYPGHGIRNSDNITSLPSNTRGFAVNFPAFGLHEASVPWGVLEPTRGNYNFSVLNTILGQAGTDGKRVICVPQYKKFNTTNATNIMPADMMGNPTYNGGYVTAGKGLCSRIWFAPVMDAYTDLHEALAEEFDDDDRLAGVYTPETATSLTSPFPSDFTLSGYATQLKTRLYPVMGSVWVHTPTFALINYTSGQVSGMVEAAYQAGLGIADTDAIDTTGSRIFAGVSVGSEIALRDYRGLVPRFTIIGSPTLGGKDDNGPPSNIINWMQLNGTTHAAWATFVTVAPNRRVDIEAAITADPNLNTSCPTAFGGTCTP